MGNLSKRHTMRIHGQMYFGVEPPFVRFIAWLPPTAPAAWGCTLQWLASIISHSWSGSTMSTSRSFSQTPRSRQRQNRRWVFSQSPRSGGRSRHGAPVHNIQNTALTNSLLSPAGRPTLPFLPGRCACRFYQTLSQISCRRCAHIASPVMQEEVLS